MKIIGFTVSKISGEKKKLIQEKLEIKSNIDIKDIQKQKINISENPGLKIDFEFKVDYDPKVANILIGGSIIVLDDDKQSEDILKNWKKKKFEHPIKLPLFNFIMEKCNLKSLQLEEDLALPFHIPLPKLTNKNTTPANYTG